MPGVCVERDDTVVRRAQKQRVADHERRRLEISRTRPRRRVRRLARRPLPRARQPRDVAAIDVGENGVLRGR